MGRKHKSSTNSTQRDDSDIATDSEVLRKFITTPKPYAPVVTQPLHLPSFDARRFHPDPINRAISEPRAAARLKLPKESAVRPRGAVQAPLANSRTPRLPATVAFSQPKQVSVCIRRKTRREVIFAKNHVGKGARARRTRNQWSDVKC